MDSLIGLLATGGAPLAAALVFLEQFGPSAPGTPALAFAESPVREGRPSVGERRVCGGAPRRAAFPRPDSLVLLADLVAAVDATVSRAAGRPAVTLYAVARELSGRSTAERRLRPFELLGKRGRFPTRTIGGPGRELR